MRDRAHPAIPRLADGDPPPPQPEASPPVAAVVVPAAIALGFGGAVLAAAVAWGAAEAAVGVLSAYLVYDLVTGSSKASALVLGGISRIATVLRGPGAPPPGHEPTPPPEPRRVP